MTEHILLSMNKILTVLQGETLYLDTNKIMHLITMKNINDVYIKKSNNIYQQIFRLYKNYKKNIDIANNLTINILLCELLYKFCVYLYTNKIIINDIIEFNSTIHTGTRSSKKLSYYMSAYNSKMRTQVLTKIKSFIRYINDNKNEDYKHSINNINEYCIYIIGLFNYNIFNKGLNNKKILPRYTNIDTFNFLASLYKYDINTLKNINNLLINNDILTQYIQTLIIQINNYIYKPAEISYITLPQYDRICWFISILNCLTYSDMSKNLLIKKKQEIPRIDKKHIFNEFIYYIIKNITSTFKRYTDGNITSDCNIFTELKNKPLKILKTIIKEEATSDKYTKDYYLDILYKICDKIEDIYFEPNKKIPSYILREINNNNLVDNYFIYVLIDTILAEDYDINTILNKSIIYGYNIQQKKDILALHIYNNRLIPLLSSSRYLLNIDYKDYAIMNNHIYIITYFYNLLEISNNYYYYYKINEEIFIKESNKTTYNDNPDVIIIESCNYNPNNNIKDNDSSFGGFLNIGDIEITFNRNRYKLDYMLHLSNDNISCPDCGHCISAIHYDNEEYIYDSKYTNLITHCEDNQISIPCPLIKQQWTDKIKTNTCYRLEKCGYIDISNSTINKIETNAYSKLCYSFDSSIIYGYVKI